MERVEAVAAAEGGWSVCDLVLRLAGAAFGGSKETSTTVCGDEGRSVVCNLRKAGCSLIADCCDGDRHEIKRDSRGLAGGHATPDVWGQLFRGCVWDLLHKVHVQKACWKR